MSLNMFLTALLPKIIALVLHICGLTGHHDEYFKPSGRTLSGQETCYVVMEVIAVVTDIVSILFILINLCNQTDWHHQCCSGSSLCSGVLKIIGCVVFNAGPDQKHKLCLACGCTMFSCCLSLGVGLKFANLLDQLNKERENRSKRYGHLH